MLPVKPVRGIILPAALVHSLMVSEHTEVLGAWRRNG